MTNFLDLPWDDVICKRILSYLSTSDIGKLQFVSKEFLHLIETYFRVSRVLNLSYCGRRPNFTATNFNSLTNGSESLRDLNLNGCKRWLNDKVLIPVLESNICLSKLDLSGSLDVTDAAIKVLALNCKFLQEIVLAECRWLTSDALLIMGLECSYLKVLVLKGCWNIDNESLAAAIRSNKSLVHIDIGSCYSINGATVSIMAKHCTNLIHLDISGCWRVGDDAIFAVKEYCKALHTLKVKDCRDVNERSLEPLRRKGVKIDVPKPPEYQRALVPIEFAWHIKEPFLNLQI